MVAKEEAVDAAGEAAQRFVPLLRFVLFPFPCSTPPTGVASSPTTMTLSYYYFPAPSLVSSRRRNRRNVVSRSALRISYSLQHPTSYRSVSDSSGILRLSSTAQKSTMNPIRGISIASFRETMPLSVVTTPFCSLWIAESRRANEREHRSGGTKTAERESDVEVIWNESRIEYGSALRWTCLSSVEEEMENDVEREAIQLEREETRLDPCEMRRKFVCSRASQ